MAPEFLHSKGNHAGFMKLFVPKNIYSMYNDAFLGKVSKNLLCHAKFITPYKISSCLISILINALAVAYANNY